MEQFRHAFENGHTDGDVRVVLKAMSEISGHHCVMVWEFRDRYGCGGDSHIAVKDGQSLRMCPEVISRFLYDGEGDASSLIGPGAIEPRDVSEMPRRIDAYNYAWHDEPDQELG